MLAPGPGMWYHREKGGIGMYDVIVCGAGCAGFCAAVAAARMGARTALVERYNGPGGILTVLGSNSIDQFNDPFRKDRKMVIGGIGWEMVRRLHKDGFARIPDMDAPYERHDQYGVKADPVAAAKVMDDMLLESGVDLYYGQSMVEAESAEGRIRSIRIATKRGLKRLEAKLFIDCTGDGELGAFAGASFAAGDGSGTFQPGTLRYYPLMEAGDPDNGDNRNHIPLDVTDSDSVTRAEIASRRLLYGQMLRGRKLLGAAPAVAPREGRRLAGLTELKSEDYCAGRVFPDSVCYSFWFVDIHREGQAAYIRYITHGNTPTVRLSNLISKDLTNLMMAGRCVSSDRETNSALRVKASCMAMGQAAGTAAAMAVREGILPKDVRPEALLEALDRSGAIIPGKPREFRDMM